MLLVGILAFIIFVSWGTVISITLKMKQETSITIAFLLITMILYITGLFNLMKYMIYFIYFLTGLAIIYILYCLVKKKVKISEIITVPVLFYGITIILLSLILRNTFYCEWDEFSHWGANLKAMINYDLFWSNNIYDGVHVVYPPLAGIVEYFFCKLHGRFAEDISYLAINVFIITLLLPFFKDFARYTKKNIIQSVLIYLCIYGNMIVFHFKLYSIYIDFLLGVLFATGMFLAFRQENKEEKIVLLLILIMLPLLKDTGLLLVGIIFMQLFFKEILIPIVKEKRITKKYLKNLGILMLILLITIAFYSSWKIYCNANDRVLDDRHDKNAISEINIKEYLKAIFLKQTTNTKYIDIARTFYDALNNISIAGNDVINLSPIKIVITLDCLGILLYNLIKNKAKKNKILSLWISFNLGFILYCLLLLATYMFAFTEQEGRALASYSRYMCTYFIAWLITSVGCILKFETKKSLLLTSLIFMMCIYTSNLTNFIDFTSRKGVSAVSQEIKNEADIIKNSVTLQDKVYLVYQNIGGGIEYHMLRYEISPIVTNLMYEWSLGPKYTEDDIWSYDITKEEWQQKLIEEKFDYVFIAKIDEQFVKIYGDLIDSNITVENKEEYNNKVFKIEKINEKQIKLHEINKKGEERYEKNSCTNTLL